MNFRIKKIVKSIAFQHVMFWIAVILLLIYPDISSGKKYVLAQVTESLVSILLIAVAVYANLVFLLPKFLRKRRYFIYIFILFVGIFFISIFDLYISENIFNKDNTVLFDKTTTLSMQRIILILTTFLLILFFVIITTFIKLLRDWLTMQDNALKMKEMERQHLEAELNSLKAQINPHFLFNTLNNLYSLSLDSSPKTPDMILKLSDLMRYIIYDCRENKVNARKEIEFVENYLSLEKLRLGDSVHVDLMVYGEPDVKVAPLLFINFLENAFKHGRRGDDSKINVVFDFSESRFISFMVENSIDKHVSVEENYYSGIGIENVKKRLALLYPDKHTLDISSDNQSYKVHLNIQNYE